MSRIAAFERRPGTRPFIYGHRGARHAAPENTMAAFELALEEGADGVELDVRMTADGVLAIHHDETFQTDDGKTHALRSLTFDEVRRNSERAGRPVPRLDEVVQFGKRTGALLNVELKDSGAASLWLAETAARALSGCERILVSSFHAGMLRRFRKLAPLVPSGYLFEKRPLLPLRWSRILAQAECVHPKHNLLEAGEALALRTGGAKVINVWTVNDPERARLLALLGVDGIITDTPGQVLSALTKD